MVSMRGGGCNKSKPLSLATVDVSVYPSCHAESCHVTERANYMGATNFKLAILENICFI